MGADCAAEKDLYCFSLTLRLDFSLRPLAEVLWINSNSRRRRYSDCDCLSSAHLYAFNVTVTQRAAAFYCDTTANLQSIIMAPLETLNNQRLITTSDLQNRMNRVEPCW